MTKRCGILPILSLLLLLSLCNIRSSAFLLTKTYTYTSSCKYSLLSSLQKNTKLDYHPAVEGWEEKYIASGGNTEHTQSSKGPRILATEFEVHAATELELHDLDVKHWPTWTTSDKEKWNVGNLVKDKEMPYGELSYVVQGKLEIVRKSTVNEGGEEGKAVIISEGDFVTFPKGFIASWKVLEELTWHYYLY